MKFGKKIKNKREEMGFTYKVLADNVGRSIGYIFDIESGRRIPPKEEVVKRMEKFLGFRKGQLVNIANKERRLSPKFTQSKLKDRPNMRTMVWSIDRDITKEELKSILELIDT